MAYLSIIVPVYNKEKFIEACIDSILSQSFKNFELILVNDGSTDTSAVKCRQYATLDSRIVLINQPNGGVSSARNKGLQVATGEYTAFVDSDDTIESDMYEILIKNALTCNADISSCRIRTMFPDKTISPDESPWPIKYGRHDSLLAFFNNDFDLNLNNKIYRSVIARQVLFAGHIYEDILYMCKVFLRAENTVIENVVKYNYIIRDNSVSMSKFNPKYMETVDVSAEMLRLVADERQDIVSAAKAFDVTANISLINLLLITEKDLYLDQYNKAVNKLNAYKDLIKNSGLIRKKHRYAFRLFSISPALYTGLMYLYCRITKSEVINRS